MKYQKSFLKNSQTKSCIIQNPLKSFVLLVLVLIMICISMDPHTRNTRQRMIEIQSSNSETLYLSNDQSVFTTQDSATDVLSSIKVIPALPHVPITCISKHGYINPILWHCTCYPGWTGTHCEKPANTSYKAFSNYIDRLDTVLYEDIFNSSKSGVFLEAGCTGSTLLWGNLPNWKGICIQPNPEYAQRIFPLFNSKRTCFIENALWDREQMIHLIDIPGLEGRTKILESFATRVEAAKFIMTNHTFQGKYFKTGDLIPLNATTLKNAFQRCQLTHIDLMILDVEGSELRALQGVDWPHQTINVMVVEGGYTEKSISEIEQLGYFYAGISPPGWDGIFFRKQYICDEWKRLNAIQQCFI